MTVHFFKSLTLAAFFAAAPFGFAEPAIAQAEPATPEESPEAVEDSEDSEDTREIVPLDPRTLRPLVSDSVFSIAGLERSIAQAEADIAAERYDDAYDTLIAARETSNALAGHYQKLSGQFSGIDNRIYEEHRRRALAAAQLRDAATYRLAIVHQGRNSAELAVPLLLQVISSQSPTRDLGRDSYNLLYELGFVDTPYLLEVAAVPNPDADPSAIAAELTDTAPPNSAEVAATSDARPLSDSILTTSGLSRLILDADTAVTSGDNETAIRKLREARQLANELSGFHQQLTDSFSGIDTDIYQTHRTNAIETAQVRDEATYKLALMFRAAARPELAVPLLMEVITSQSPTRDLGKQAYRQLYELGFVDTNYPRGQV
ncbi:MAG: hypothetical protein ACFB9N_10060 [Geitlerinemataceae cyanobacterium]